MYGIATGINALAMTGRRCHCMGMKGTLVIASEQRERGNLMRYTLVIASEQRERGNLSHEKGVATVLVPCMGLPRVQAPSQ